MRRRGFITLIGVAAAAWPLAARAQQPAKVPTIGFLGAATQLSWTQWTASFVQRLSELGWVEGSTVRIEYRLSRCEPHESGQRGTRSARHRVATRLAP